MSGIMIYRISIKSTLIITNFSSTQFIISCLMPVRSSFLYEIRNRSYFKGIKFYIVADLTNLEQCLWVCVYKPWCVFSSCFNGAFPKNRVRSYFHLSHLISAFRLCFISVLSDITIKKEVAFIRISCMSFK